MGKYRASNLDLSTRMEIVAEMMLLVKERGWGRVTELARIHGVSRTRLYQLKECVHEMFTTALLPKNPGPQVSTRDLRVDEAHPISKRLERAAYQAIETADQSRVVAAAAQQPRRKRGSPVQAKLSVPEAEALETTTIETLDLWLWLLQEVRLALEPITPLGHICVPQVARNNIETAIELMAELRREDISNFAHKLHNYLDDLLAPLVELENRLALARATLSEQDERLVTFIWQQRQDLTSPWTELFPSTWQATVQAFDQALSLFHRASSLAESIHAWVRPYLQIHRGMPQWLAPLLQLFWNQHRFQRGKRAGSTPAELAGLSELPSLAQLFANLFEPEAIPSMC